MVYYSNAQICRKFVIMGMCGGTTNIFGSTRRVLQVQGGTTALKGRYPGKKANTGGRFVENKKIGKF
jgi:hypothetical protein